VSAVLSQTNSAAKGSARPAPSTASAKANPIDMLGARAEARAFLFAIGELELHQAVDVLQHDAVENGLVDQIGQDKVQDILAAAFAAVRSEPERVPDAFPDDEAPDRHVPRSTLDAAVYLLRQNDAERLERWLQAHSRTERAEIVDHLDQLLERKNND
jgi:hypothetical protein